MLFRVKELSKRYQASRKKEGVKPDSLEIKETKRFKMSIVTTPREIQLLIFGQLRVPDLVRLSETCHRLKEVARDPFLWKKLTLTYDMIKNKNEACRNHVSRCSILREIDITGHRSVIRSDQIMTVVMKAKNSLTSINITPRLGLSNSSFAKIGKIAHLNHLAVGGIKLGPGGISALACLLELKTFKVPSISCWRYTDGTAALVDLFSKLKKLEQVDIMGMKFPAVKSLLDNNPNLHHLSVVFLSSRCLNLIADKCPQLTHIGISSVSEVSDTSITKLLSSCPKLKYANFAATKFNDTTLATLSENCLDLEYLEYLEYLNIVGCENVTEEALERFANPATTANLKKLCISKYSPYYSPQLADRLKLNLPDVEIVIIEDFTDLL